VLLLFYKTQSRTRGKKKEEGFGARFYPSTLFLSNMERSIRFNNAGVDCLNAGQDKIAWDFFKGALEVKLAVERSDTGTQNQAEGSSPLAMDPAGNSYVQKAAEHYHNLTSYHSSEGELLPAPPAGAEAFAAAVAVTDISSTQTPATRQESPKVEVSCCGSFYSPFLYSHPMKLRQESAISTRRESATIIFNLALVDHMKNRCSEQAVALYELAMTLLTGDTVDTLGIALVNNIGVWCYENGDVDGALTCMGHLATFINACKEPDIAMEEREALLSNILWLLNPPFAASPAA
jgi:hypothetical protein